AWWFGVAAALGTTRRALCVLQSRCGACDSARDEVTDRVEVGLGAADVVRPGFDNGRGPPSPGGDHRVPVAHEAAEQDDLSSALRERASGLQELHVEHGVLGVACVGPLADLLQLGEPVAPVP